MNILAVLSLVVPVGIYIYDRRFRLKAVYTVNGSEGLPIGELTIRNEGSRTVDLEAIVFKFEDEPRLSVDIRDVPSFAVYALADMDGTNLYSLPEILETDMAKSFQFSLEDLVKLRSSHLIGKEPLPVDAIAVHNGSRETKLMTFEVQPRWYQPGVIARIDGNYGSGAKVQPITNSGAYNT